MLKTRLVALLALVLAAAVGFFVYTSEINKTRPFKLGLDLSGGTHIVYEADTKDVAAGDIGETMEALRETIERRVNLFGVSEPVVQVESGGVPGGGRINRLVVELPGVTDVDQAMQLIGKTPLLEFKLMRDMSGVSQEELEKKTLDEVFIPTPLTGRFLSRSQVIFDQTTGQPKVLLAFNDEGSELFAKITKENIGKVVSIFLDGIPISSPVVREEITGGTAEISGGFNLEEARELVRNLNYGALPVHIIPVGTQTIGATLGSAAVSAGVYAGWIAFALIALFLLVWYRVPGIIATVALCVYVALNLAIFKLIPVTLTAAGIAGFILSLGMAVDANILIFERMKEELARGKKLSDAMHEGFSRAWASIRDSNLSSIITAVILYYFATTPIIKGFALVFAIGVVTSMFTAITVSRTLLYALGVKGQGKFVRVVFGSGVR
ncbi:MAG: preprotein translocase subunit SecD [Parcubacteria group bacterium Gr01-1014_72]|nr:MAG: preprotein translocase subunit SecD [Parcubacteria group bacterium Gr01-1014_72]